MKVEALEKRFMLISAGLLAAFMVALVLSVTQDHATLPEPAGRLDPALVRQTAPFDAPGLREVAPGEYEAVMIAQAWLWEPAELRVPVGSTVHFRITSADVIHGFRVPDTNANVMVIPGQISDVTVEFDEAGLYSVICHEYCGIGHHQMGGTIVVEGEG